MNTLIKKPTYISTITFGQLCALEISWDKRDDGLATHNDLVDEINRRDTEWRSIRLANTVEFESKAFQRKRIASSNTVRKFTEKKAK